MQPTNSVGIAKLAFCNWLSFQFPEKESGRPDNWQLATKN
jgi:hypothetical protein